MSTTAFQTLEYSRAGRTGVVTLDRPDRRNSMTSEMVAELFQLLTEAARDASLAVLVLKGRGADFCAGADLKGPLSRGDTTTDAEADPRIFQVPVLLHTMPAVTIAAISGACAGAGLGWACACDLRIASESARFNTAFLDVGVAGDMGGPWLLSRIVGPAKARELYLLPGKFTAERALDIGLVSAVYPDDQFHNGLNALVDRLAAAAPLALRAVKANFVASEELDLPAFVALETQRHLDLLQTADAKEAFIAFAAKRAPDFQGR